MSFPPQRNCPLYDETYHNTGHSDNWDDPRQLYQKGILSRDGGHFQALFPNEEKAERFRNAAGSLLIRELPGLRFEISMKAVVDKIDNKVSPAKKAQTQAIFDLPPLQVCQESGNGPALAKYYPIGGDKNAWVSEATRKNKEAGKLFFNGLRYQDKKPNRDIKPTRDIIGLLSHKLPPVGYSPIDLEHLCGNEYLAVIHADGNSVGNRFKQWQQSPEKPTLNQEQLHNFLLNEAHGERFFHSMRVAVRRAVVDSLTETFKRFESKYRPDQLLMLGGDDLLLVCQAKYAFDFLVH